MALDIVEVEVGVEADEIFALVEDDLDCVETEPMRPSTYGLGAGFDGSFVGLGVLGITSYKVPY